MHEHSIYDTDPHFVIDAVTRAITTQSKKLKLMQYDHNSERLTFEMPRHIDGHDMSLCNKIEVHYNNIDAQTKEQSKDVYPVDDMQISPKDENIVILSWLISRNATKFAGTLNFLIRFSCIAEDATIEYAWNTDIFAGITVSNGINNTEYVAEQYSDVLEAWKNEFEKHGVSDERIEAAVKNYFAEKPIAKIGNVTLLASNWVEKEDSLYFQVVEIEGVTENSQVDLTPSVEQLAIFYGKDLTFVTENEGGVVTVYAIGQKPQNDYIIQVTITEVEYE